MISDIAVSLYDCFFAPTALMPLTPFLIAMAVTVVVTWRIIPALKKMNTVQNIYEDAPESHQGKKGTPTMGGVAIIAGILFASVYSQIILGFDMNLLVVTLVMVGFGLIGFIDDYTKIAARRNKGLTPKQKLALQVALSLAFAFYMMVFDANGHTIIIPFIWKSIEIGWFIIPYIAFILVAMTNAVNLTDGLDGLCAGTSACVSFWFPLFLYSGGLAWSMIMWDGFSGIHPMMLSFDELTAGIGGIDRIPMGQFFIAIGGACFGFLIFNRHPAKIFMGDTGSLALGGAIAAAAIWAKAELLLPIAGVIFVAEALSVIIQVSSYKLRNGKRVFKMAPLHHHFELSGCSEKKVVNGFFSVTVFACVVLNGILRIFG